MGNQKQSIRVLKCIFAVSQGILQDHGWNCFLGRISVTTLSLHSSLRTSPYQVLYGRAPPTLLSYVKGSGTTLRERDVMLSEIRYHLQQAQDRMKLNAYRKRRELQFQVGDLVYLGLRPYRQQSVLSRCSHKLRPRFAGPFLVIRKVGEAAYELPPEARIHNVFHVFVLKPALGRLEVADPVTVSKDFKEWILSIVSRSNCHGCRGTRFFSQHLRMVAYFISIS